MWRYQQLSKWLAWYYLSLSHVFFLCLLLPSSCSLVLFLFILIFSNRSIIHRGSLLCDNLWLCSRSCRQLNHMFRLETNMISFLFLFHFHFLSFPFVYFDILLFYFMFCIILYYYFLTVVYRQGEQYIVWGFTIVNEKKDLRSYRLQHELKYLNQNHILFYFTLYIVRTEYSWMFVGNWFSPSPNKILEKKEKMHDLQDRFFFFYSILVFLRWWISKLIIYCNGPFENNFIFIFKSFNWYFIPTDNQIKRTEEEKKK